MVPGSPELTGAVEGADATGGLLRLDHVDPVALAALLQRAEWDERGTQCRPCLVVGGLDRALKVGDLVLGDRVVLLVAVAPTTPALLVVAVLGGGGGGRGESAEVGQRLAHAAVGALLEGACLRLLREPHRLD